MSRSTATVTVDGDKITVLTEGRDPVTLSAVPLPGSLLEWFLEGRREGFERLKRGEGPGTFFSRHLPVVATVGDQELFPIRLAHKGVGFLPAPNLLDNAIVAMEELFERTSRSPGPETLRERLEGLGAFYRDPENLDPGVLGSLEIFAGGTFTNLIKDPFASLIFTEPGPPYVSFQIDCAVQVVEPPDPRFRFLQLTRGLFEKDPFHVTQPGVKCAYLFWITGITDKTPHPLPDKTDCHRL